MLLMPWPNYLYSFLSKTFIKKALDFYYPIISTAYPEGLFVIPEAHANYQDSSSAPAQ